MRSTYILVFILLALFSRVFCQNENSIWVFASDKKVSFANATPQVSYESNNLNFYNEPYVAVCNEMGELLFYSEGVKFYDRNHQAMSFQTPFPVSDGTQAGTRAYAIKLFNNTNDSEYAIFSIDNNYSDGDLYISVIDMNLRNGLGDIVGNSQNIIGTNFSMHCTIINDNCGGYWLVAHSRGENKFVSYKFIGSELITVVESKIGTAFQNYKSADQNVFGSLTYTKDGKLIYVDTEGTFEIFNFDFANGEVSDFLSIYDDSEASYSFYDAEISEDGNFLYVTARQNSTNYLLQFELSSYDPDIFRSSIYSLTLNHLNTTGGALNGLKLAPDKRIYLISPGRKNYIGTINYPNEKGDLIQFDSVGIQFNSIVLSKSFPSDLFLESKTINNFIKSESSLCFGNELSIVENISFDSIIWSTKEKSYSIQPSRSGLYSVEIYKDGCVYKDSIEVSVSPLLRSDTLNVCYGDTIYYKGMGFVEPANITDTIKGQMCDTILKISLQFLERIEQESILGICEGEQYKASDGTLYAAGDVITTIKPSMADCDTILKTKIVSLPLPNPFIHGQRVLCFGTQTELMVSSIFTEYDWNTGDSTRIVKVGEGSFQVKVIDSLGCEGSAQVTVIERPEWLLEVLEAVETEGNYLFRLDGDVARINEWTVTPSEDLFLLAGDRLAADGNTSPGLYRLEVKDEIGCISSVDFEIPEKVKSPATQQSNVLHPGSGNPDNRVWKARLPQNTTLDFAGIYDRWGNEIWSTQDPSIGWDGSIEGKEVDGGVYVFVIRYQLGTGGKELQVGSVLLVK